MRDHTRALRKKRPDLLFDRVLLHQENAPCHMAREAMIEIDLLNFELLPHAPYSPPLPLLTFYFFDELNANLRGICFQTSEDSECCLNV